MVYLAIDLPKLLAFGEIRVAAVVDPFATDERARQALVEACQLHAVEIGVADREMLEMCEHRHPPEHRAELGGIHPDRQRLQIARTKQSARNAVPEGRPADTQNLQMRVGPRSEERRGGNSGSVVEPVERRR